jgi:hypothetical protein
MPMVLQAGISSVRDAASRKNPMTNLCDIESRLRQIIEAVQTGQDDQLDELLDELDALVMSMESAGAAEADPEELARIRNLWKQAALALAAAGQDAKGQLVRVVAGQKTLKAYKA